MEPEVNQVVLYEKQVEVFEIIFDELRYWNHAEALVLGCNQGHGVARHYNYLAYVTIFQKDPKVLNRLLYVVEIVVILATD